MNFKEARRSKLPIKEKTAGTQNNDNMIINLVNRTSFIGNNFFANTNNPISIKITVDVRGPPENGWVQIRELISNVAE